MNEREVYFVHYNGASVFVKEGEFFKSQGGLKEPWGEHWVPVVATSIEDAREKGYVWFGVRRTAAQRAART